MYVKTLLERKDKNAKKGIVINLLKKVAVFGGLIVLGVLAGFIIKSKSGKGNKEVGQTLQASPLVSNNQVNESVTGSVQENESVIDPSVQKDKKDDQEPSQKTGESTPTSDEPTTQNQGVCDGSGRPGFRQHALAPKNQGSAASAHPWRSL